MELHRYLGSHIYETLRDKRLLLAKPSNLNDPFEFLYRTPKTISESEARKFIKMRRKSDNFYQLTRREYPSVTNKKEFKRMMNERIEELSKRYRDSYPGIAVHTPEYSHKLADQYFRIVSFSSVQVLPQDDILLWSHYAAKHTGARIRFSFNENLKSPYFMRKIQYKPERVELNLATGLDDGRAMESFAKAIATKAMCWKYEDEYRMFFSPLSCDQVPCPDGISRDFFSFTKEQVVGVDFGLKCPETEVSKITRLVQSQFPHARVRRAQPNPNQFLIDYIEQ